MCFYIKLKLMLRTRISEKFIIHFTLLPFILIGVNHVCIGMQQSNKGIEKTGSLPYKRPDNLILNKNKGYAWNQGYLNRFSIEKVCTKSKPCFASDAVVPLCATDNQTYLNPGVLICAQQCDKALRIGKYGFRPCPGHTIPPTIQEEHNEYPHKSPPSRLKVPGVLQKMFKWLGFHIHQDGGVYIADEKTHDVWWNV